MGRRFDKGWYGRAGAVLLAFAAAPAWGGSLDSPGCLGGGSRAAVTAVDEALDLHLADGRLVHLPGIALGDAPVEARRDLEAWLTHAAVTLVPLLSEPDRWGRTVALAFAPPPGDPERPVSVVEALIEAGRVMARPDPALDTCWATLLRLEREAEHAQRGLWHGSPVLRPDDGAALQAHAGGFTIVSGRVATVRQGRARLYVRFAADGGTGMAATLTRPLLRRLGKSGEAPQAWVGRPVRVRGLLDDRWGWQIEVTTPQQLEFDRP